MPQREPLEPAALYRVCDPSRFDFRITAELQALTEVVGQERVLQALHFGVGIRRPGFNLYVLGAPGAGKHTAVRRFLAERAASQPPADDWCYVNHFAEPGCPRVLRLPAGHGARLRADMDHLVEELRAAIPAGFESADYRARLTEIEGELKRREEQALSAVHGEAQAEHIVLLRTPAGFAFAPTRDGDVLEPDAFAKLPEEEQQRVRARIEHLQERLQEVLRTMPQHRRDAQARVRELNREAVRLAVGHLVAEVRRLYAEFPQVLAHLDAVQQDVIDNADAFRPREDGARAGSADESPLHRYRVNLLVDHGADDGAPVVYEDHPAHDNLVGRVEHRAQMGALVTDFTLIRPGALHRANGGYLLLDAHKVLSQPYAWDALKRVLSAGEIRIQSLGQVLSLVSTVSLQPEPIPVDVKVVLIGDRLLYYLLQQYDPEFGELFKVAADFEEDMTRSADSEQVYARLVATLAGSEGLRPLDAGGVARVIEHGARVAGDGAKLSVHLGSLVDLLREADYWTGEDRRQVVSAADVQRAIDQQIYRADRVRARVLEDMERGAILVDTDGAVAGQVNALSVIELGNFSFGQPSRITATVRIGDGDVVDIEREVDLGGSLHSKGVLILSNFLASRYARSRPLSLCASLVFEQSYGGVDGDSASAAELCALLSAIAELPIRQFLGVTGSVNQHGQVQVVGGINEKVEGFFDLCKTRGLSGEHGVLIPAGNAEHLMLRAEVVEAARAGRFHVYAVETVDQALELLTGVPAGERDARGRFPRGSVNRRVEDRLMELADLRQAFSDHTKSGDDDV